MASPVTKRSLSNGRPLLAIDRSNEQADLAREVQDALDHLDDPVRLQTHPLARLICSAQATKPTSPGKALRQALEEAIEALKPAAKTSELSHGWRGHDILRLRYLEGLGVRGVVERLALSRSEYYRDHRRAVQAVAVILRQRWEVVNSAESRADLAERAPLDLAARRPELSVVTAPSSLPPNNLPLSLTSFVGREREIAEVSKLLGTSRLLTLTGSGGCGKTRLALEVARGILHACPERYPDGAWLVELAALSDPLLVPQAVLSSLGAREASGQPILETLLAYLRTRRVLLVLDNCEHLVDACAHLADGLLRACPKLQLLTTSREALGIAGETTYRVPSLSLPDVQNLPSLADLVEYDSVRLFVERAVAAESRFAVNARNAQAVAQVCWRLDGIPLAIELAAVRLRVLGAEQIASRLDDRFRLLVGGSRTALPRHQTLKAAIDWSHELLAEPERLLFRRLAVFAGGFTIEAAESVCSGDGVEAADILDLLTRLVDRSLVLVEAAGGTARYRLLETIREYGWDRLAEAGEADDVRSRHLDFFLALAERASESIWVRDDFQVWIDRLEAEHDNLRSALRRCEETDASAFLRLATSLWKFWASRGYTVEGRHWLDEALRASPERTALRQEALDGAGMLASDHGDYSSAKAYWEEYLALCRERGDRQGEGNALTGLGQLAGAVGDHETALDLLTKAISLLRGLAACEAGSARDPLTCLTGLARLGLAFVAGSLGDYRLARASLEESKSLFASARKNNGWTSFASAELYSAEGDYERARSLSVQSLQRASDIGDEPGRGYVLATLGNVARLVGDHETARARIGESLGVVKAIGHRQRLGRTIAFSALLAADEGQYDRAARLVGSASAVHEHFRALLWKADLDALDASLCTVRTALGEDAFARGLAEGQAMTLEQAVEYALQHEY